MRILLIDQYATTGGAQKCVIDLVPAFLGRGWSVHALIPGAGTYENALLSAGARISYLPCGPFSHVWKTGADVMRLLGQLPSQVTAIRTASRDADLVYVVGPRVLPAVALARLREPIVFHAHNIIGQGAASALVRQSVRMAGMEVIACCEAVARVVASNRARVIYNGVPSYASERLVPAEALRTIGLIGRLDPEKGVREFVEAARILTARYADLRFVIAGSAMFSGDDDAFHRELKQRAQGLPVQFTGWSHDIASTLAGIEYLVVPSNDLDATPRTIMEAYSGGVPVIAFASGGIPEIVEDGVTGVLVSERSASGLADAISSILEHPELRQQLSKNARQRWTERYQLERYRSDVCGVFEEVLDRRQRRAPVSNDAISARV